MNYYDNIEQTFTNQLGPDVPQAYIYGVNGGTSVLNVANYLQADYSLEHLFMDVAGQFRNSYGYEDYVAFFTFSNNYGTYLFTSTEVDYVILKANGGSLNAKCYISGSDIFANLDGVWFDDLSTYNGYPQYNYNDTFTTYSYSSYDVTATSGKSMIFDYSAIRENIYNENYRQEWPIFLNRYDMRSYYTIPLSLTGNGLESFDISYGKPLYNIYKNGYASGYSNGYTNGRTDYTGTGNQSPTGNAVPTALTYIGNAFNGIAGFMSIEVLPNITLGLCFSIPLVLVLIMTIFKVVKK